MRLGNISAVRTRGRFGLAAILILLGVINTAHAAEPERTEIRIVTEGGFLPWNYTEPNGMLAGFEIDLANDLCHRMQVKCTITAQALSGMIPALNAGKFDAIMDDIVITPKRQEIIAFSIPYASVCYTFAVLKDSNIGERLGSEHRVVSLEDESVAAGALRLLRDALRGKTIGALTAGTSVGFIDAYLNGVAFMRQYNSPEARDLDLAAGRVDVIVGSRDALLGTAARHGGSFIKLVGPCFQGGVVGTGTGVGLRKKDTTLKAMFDKAITEAIQDGTIKRLSVPVFGMDVTPQ